MNQKMREDTVRGAVLACIYEIMIVVVILCIVLLIKEMPFYYKMIPLLVLILCFIGELKIIIIPIINHYNNESVYGDIVVGKVDISNGILGGGKFIESYDIKGFYNIGDKTYCFRDYFFYDSTELWCAFHRILENEKVPCEIEIVVNTDNPLKYCVRGVEYLAKLKELYPEYFI